MKESAGILAYRVSTGGESIEILLVHPGGPFWAKKDEGAWTIPKGELTEGEEPTATARREFREELGIDLEGEFVELGAVKQKGGKLVHAFAVSAENIVVPQDPAAIETNRFQMEWPPRSGKLREFPEIDRAEWFSLEAARTKMNPAQAVLLDRLAELLKL